MATLREAAREAGQLALSLQSGAGRKSWEKSPGHLVTEADLAVNTLLARRLGAARPRYGWLSEETVDDLDNRAQSRVWVVDPIDGTRAYMREEDPFWCVAIAIVERGEVLGGVVYAPMFDALYEARRGGGALLNGRPVFASSRDRVTGCRMIANAQMFTHPAWPQPWPAVETADPKPNATLLRMALVASGAWDATLALGPKSDWDLAAGTILVHEAGGIVTTHGGEAFSFNRTVPAQRSLLAAGKRLHPLLLQRTKVVPVPDPQAGAGPDSRHQTSEFPPMGDTAKPTRQLLHLVIGGELKNVQDVEFEDLSQIDFVGAFASYAAAYDAWKEAAQRTVDNAEMRYFILHAHKLLDPETGSHHHV